MQHNITSCLSVSLNPNHTISFYKKEDFVLSNTIYIENESNEKYKFKTLIGKDKVRGFGIIKFKMSSEPHSTPFIVSENTIYEFKDWVQKKKINTNQKKCYILTSKKIQLLLNRFSIESRTIGIEIKKSHDNLEMKKINLLKKN